MKIPDSIKSEAFDAVSRLIEEAPFSMDNADLITQIIDEVAPILYVDDAVVEEEGHARGYLEGFQAQEAEVRLMGEEIARLEGSVATGDNEYASLEAEYGKLETDISALEDEKAALEAKIVEYGDLITELQDLYDKVDTALRRTI